MERTSATEDSSRNFTGESRDHEKPVPNLAHAANTLNVFNITEVSDEPSCPAHPALPVIPRLTC
jgi:hypothetical protein